MAEDDKKTELDKLLEEKLPTVDIAEELKKRDSKIADLEKILVEQGGGITSLKDQLDSVINQWSPGQSKKGLVEDFNETSKRIFGE